MPTADDYAAAFLKEHEAGNRERAQIFADAYREALAEEQASSAPQQPAVAAQADPAAQQQPEPDTYLTRSLGGLKRAVGSGPGLGKFVADNFMTGVKAAVQGIPFVGPYTDNLYAEANSALTGRNPEEVRREYMAPVEAMNPFVRAAAQVAGGVTSTGIPGVGKLIEYAATRPALLTPIIAAIESVISGPGRRDSGKPIVDDIIENGVGDAVVGAAGGAGGLVAGKLLGVGAQGLEDVYRIARGRPLSPFRGKGAAEAQERVAEAIRNNAPLAPVRADRPLLDQPAGAALSKQVVNFGDESAGKVVAAAKTRMADRSATRAAGSAFQELGIVPLGVRTAPGEVARSPSVSSNRIASLLGNPDMKKIVERVRRDLRFDGIGDGNLTFLHEVNTRLAKAAGKANPAKAENIQVLRAALSDAIEEVAPGYKAAQAAYRAAAAEAKAAQEMAKAAGGSAKFVKGDRGVPFFNIGNSASGTPEGMKFRAITNIAAHIAERIGLSSDKQANAIIARILTETDPEQIAAAIAAVGKPVGGRPYRPMTVFQGNNALLPWRNEEAR